MSVVAERKTAGWRYNPVTVVRRQFEEATVGGTIFPLAILFMLFMLDEFDTAAVNVLGPDIRDAFHLSNQEFGAVVVLNLAVLILLGIPAGYLGDRRNRTRMVVVCAAVAAASSGLTGLAPVVGVLIGARIGNGFGRMVNDPVHHSLLTDYYEPGVRPKTFALHQNAVTTAGMIGPLFAGLVGTLFGWRATFVLLLPMTLVVVVAATRLKEPIRGATDVGGSEEVQPPPPFREAVRILRSVRTLRREYLAWVFIGAGALPLAFLLPLFLERVFHLGPGARGVDVAVNAAATFAGVKFSGRRTLGWAAKGMGEPIRRAGGALAIIGVLLLGVAYLPWLPAVVAVGLVTSFFVGLIYPPLFATQALVSPARVRSMSFSFGALYLVVGGLLYIVLLGWLANGSIRNGLASSAPFWVIAGLVLASAGQFVADDVGRAFAMPPSASPPASPSARPSAPTSARPSEEGL